MNPRVVELPYGDASMTFRLPSRWHVDVAYPREEARPRELSDLVAEALRHPLDSPPLSELAAPGMRVTIVVPDLTRPCPTALLLKALLPELEGAGVSPGSITVLIGLGMHRRLQKEEIQRVIGDRADRVHVVEAQGADENRYRDLGTWTSLPEGRALPAPVPVRVHPTAMDCDLLLAVGVVEPHQVAGFSGGGKAVGIGTAGAATIGALHGILFLSDPGTRLGALEGNPFRETVDAIADRAGLRFALNVAPSWKGTWMGAAAGKPECVIRHLARTAEPWTSVSPVPYDLVLAGVGRGKDQNLYQATRALTYLAFSPEPVISEGGWVALVARCPEGGGAGPGEREFMKHLRGSATPDAVVAALTQSGYRAGGQRAFLVARALSRYRGMVVGGVDPDGIRDAHLTLAGDPSEALRSLPWNAEDEVRVLVVPNALAILPRPAREGGRCPRIPGPGLTRNERRTYPRACA